MKQGEAEGRLLRKYLGSFCLARPEDFALWTGMRVSDAKEIWDREEVGPARLDVEGQTSWMLRRDLDELEGDPISEESISFLPCFDSYLLGQRSKLLIVDEKWQEEVYRPQGWIAPVLLCDGRVRGTWSHRIKGKTLRLTLKPFRRLSKHLLSSVHREAEETADFLGCEETSVELE